MIWPLAMAFIALLAFSPIASAQQLLTFPAGVGATGGLFNRMGARRQHEEQQRRTQAQYQDQWQQFNRAVATCLTGRGYAVS